MPNSSRKSSRSDLKPRKKITKRPNPQFSLTARRITAARLPPEWLPDLNLLRRVIERTRAINSPKVDLFSPAGLPRSPRLRIATISTDLDVGQLSPSERQDYKVWMVKEVYRKQLRKDFLRYLEQAGEERADLVCFNELAYPTPLDLAGDSRFQARIKKLVTRFRLTLVAGSYHDTIKYYNLSPVIGRLAPLKDAPHVYTHAKMTSAVKAFEFIRIPPNRQLRYYQTEHGAFTILICLDVYDPSMVFRLMMKNHLFSTEEKIDFVFVPSFTPTGAPGLAHACQDLSYATAALVVYVNCAANKPRHAVYLGGQEIKKGSNVKCSAKTISENVVIYEVTYDEYHRVRTKVNDEYSPVFDYLIGHKDGLRFDLTP